MSKSVFLVLLTLFLISGCTSNKDSDKEAREASIISISGPSEVISGQTATIEVQFPGVNGCSEKFQLKTEQVGQYIYIRAYYLQPVEPVVCTEQLPIFKLNYRFYTDMGGTYFFVSEQNDTIKHTLIVR